MYLAKVTVNARDPQQPNLKYKKLMYNGLFVTKPDSKMTREEIRERIRGHIASMLESKNPGLHITVSVYVDYKMQDFALCEKED